MTSRERLLTAASFREPDRVPIELNIGPKARLLPEAERIAEFIDHTADNFQGVAAVDWGFFGLDSRPSEEVIEDRPGEYRRVRRTQRTAAGDFVAVTRHFYPHIDSSDYQWERRYVDTLDEMARLADARRHVRPLLLDRHRQQVAAVGDRGVPIMGLAHPLGTLVRLANMEEAYGWLLGEPGLMHRFLASSNEQVRQTVLALGAAGISGWFVTYAHEMLIPPWLGRRHFDEFVFPYDKAVNDAVHAIGGRHRSHCHGTCMQFLERMAEMGVDATEPLEPAPFGDVDRREAKRTVGQRMLLSGNVPSQDFLRLTPQEVREWVRRTIAELAPGGGFSLRTTGGHAGVDPDLDRDQLRGIIRNVHAYFEAGLEFGTYPICA